MSGSVRMRIYSPVINSEFDVVNDSVYNEYLSFIQSIKQYLAIQFFELRSNTDIQRYLK